MQVISSDRVVASVNPKGARLDSIIFDNLEILKQPSDDRPTHSGMALMLPYANRVRSASYIWNGAEYNLPRDREGNSIHGLVLDRIWRISAKTGSEVCLVTELPQGHLPSTLEVQQAYTVKDNELMCRTTASNKGIHSCPFMVGYHPYFLHYGSWNVLASEVKRLNYVDRYFPDGTLTTEDPNILSSKSGKIFDNCFTMHDVTLTTERYFAKFISSEFGYYVLYSGEWTEGKSVALEPMTGAVNCYHNRMGLITIEPGETYTVELRIILYQSPTKITK